MTRRLWLKGSAGIRFNKRSLLLFVMRFIIPGRQRREPRGCCVYRRFLCVDGPADNHANTQTAPPPANVESLFPNRASSEEVLTIPFFPPAVLHLKTQNATFDRVLTSPPRGPTGSRQTNRLPQPCFFFFIFMKASRGNSNYARRILPVYRYYSGIGGRTAGGRSDR